MKKAKSFNKIIYIILKYSVGYWFRLFYPVKLTNPELLKKLTPPYLLLPNHTMKWDAVLLCNLFPTPVNCMGSESLFRKPLKAFLLSLIGIFPKTKAKNDLVAIRHMMDLKQRGKVICVFPEGQMSWDGASLPLIWSTAKLVKLLKIPVYVPLFSGGSAVFPRWGKSRRKGSMELRILPLFETPSEIKGLKVEEIYQKLSDLHNHDELKVILDRQWCYTSSSKAEYLENILFICPRCLAIASISSQGNNVICHACSLQAELNEQYRLVWAEGKQSDMPGGKKLPGNLPEWNSLQRDVLKNLLRQYSEGEAEHPFMKDGNVLIKTGYRTGSLKTWTKRGDMVLFRDHLLLHPEKGDIRIIPFDEISGVHIMTMQKLEFYHDQSLYAFFFPSLRISGYKWLCALRQLGVLSSSYAWHGEEVERI